MKRSCKNIDITDWRTIYPWVLKCVLDHKKRFDFQKLVCTIGRMEKKFLKSSLATNDNLIFEFASEFITKEAANRIKRKQLDLNPVTYRIQIDASSYKARPIGNESAMQQIFDHIAVQSCKEIWKRRLLPQQIAGIKERGPIYGTQMIQNWIRKDICEQNWSKTHGIRYTSKCRFFAKLDIKQCYPSLRVSVFMNFFKRDCANEDILWLWETLLSSHRVYIPFPVNNLYEGFMIGAWPSQWACQYLISFIYRFAMDIHARGNEIKSISHMLIQMDDLLLISSSRKNLKNSIYKIVNYAKTCLCLEIKPSWHIQKFSDTPIDIVGYLVHCDGSVTIRPRIFIRARRIFLRCLGNRNGISIKQARRICAYKGYFVDDGSYSIKKRIKHSDSWKIRKQLNLNYVFKKAQQIVSDYDKKKGYLNDWRYLYYFA